EAWYRARFGTGRSRVQIPPSRPLTTRGLSSRTRERRHAAWRDAKLRTRQKNGPIQEVRGCARGERQLQAKCVDKSRNRGGLLPPTRVVEKEAGERRAPIFQHPNKCPARDVVRRAIVRHERQADAIDRR